MKNLAILVTLFFGLLIGTAAAQQTVITADIPFSASQLKIQHFRRGNMKSDKSIPGNSCSPPRTGMSRSYF